MDRHPRRSAPLEISDRVRDLLASMRGHAGIEGPADLDVDRVRDVEATMGAGIPDVVLAILAAEIPRLSDDLDLGLGRIARHTADARTSRAHGAFVAIGTADGHVFVGFDKGADPQRLSIFDGTDRSTASITAVNWLLEYAEDEGGALSPFEPRLVLAPPPPVQTPTSFRRARHRTWGVGTVLAELGEGPTRKVKIDFPGIGLKVVQARFIEFLPD